MQARFLGPFKDFNVIDYAENLMHSKLNLLFALIPRLRPAGIDIEIDNWIGILYNWYTRYYN